jgi:hypothetical protein
VTKFKSTCTLAVAKNKMLPPMIKPIKPKRKFVLPELIRKNPIKPKSKAVINGTIQGATAGTIEIPSVDSCLNFALEIK